MTNNHTKAQFIALGNYLSEYPYELPYEEILKLLENEVDHDNLSPAEFFEDWHAPALAEEIEGLRYAIDLCFSEVIEALELAVSKDMLFGETADKAREAIKRAKGG